ncbi:hypothetical protein FRC00_002872 [Tulasnella sp. 408]|nr:hypothetical protein FRC00_002872 [Tulasnella sp. 408]
MKGKKCLQKAKSKNVLEKCANCISRENATFEPKDSEIDAKRPSNATTPVLSMPVMVSPAQAPQPASPLTPLPEPCVPIACLATGSPIPGSSLPESRALGLALPPQLGRDPTTPIRAPVPCTVTTPATPPEAFRVPSPGLSPASMPSNLCQLATALNSFLTLQEDELAFERGDTIVVLDSPAHPTGWLLGQHSSGRRGLFPARYVKLAP